FQGQLDGSFSAYDAATGELKWVADLKSGGASGPGTYEIEGEQYVTITTGWGSAYALAVGLAYDEKVPPVLGKVVTFKLGGTEQIAASTIPLRPASPQTEPFGDLALINAGREDFARNCRVCHGYLAESSGVLPDLRWSAYTADAEAWNAVILQGTLAGNGMVSFSEQLDVEASEAIRAYVVHRAYETTGPDAAETGGD
ncbi:MAG: c-type cytochrome, partial [Pseudomonadota bacterium]